MIDKIAGTSSERASRRLDNQSAAVAGLVKWIEGGGVLDMASMEGGAIPFLEVIGIIVHAINGTFVIPGIALLLLILSFFTRVSGAIKWALIVFSLVVVRGLLGYLGHEVTAAGALHGVNALLLFGTALYAGRRMRAAAPSKVSQPAERVAVPV